MQLLSNARTMRWDWDGWLMGVFGAIMSGVGVGLAALGIGISWQKSLILVGIAAGISLGKYLQTKPTPDPHLENASIESAKSVAQAVRAADAVQDAKDAGPRDK
jgi:hypothetical protein